jgi:hypothetical protein
MRIKTVRIYIIALIAVSALFASAQEKVIDKSQRSRPSWVDGVQPEYIIALGSGPTIDQARENAIIRVKELIVSSIADNVKTRSELSTETVNNNNIHSFLQSYKSQTLTQSADIPYLQGISLARVEEYYWEKLENRQTKELKVHYHVKYPFPRREMILLMDDFITADRALTRKLDDLIEGLSDHTSVESLVQSIHELEHMSKSFVDQRKNRAELGLIQGNNLLKSIQIVVKENTPGRLVYNLQIGGRPVTSAQKPNVKSNCAVIQSVLPEQENMVVNYHYDNCYDDPENAISIAYRFDNARIENAFHFNIKQYSVDIFLKDDIIFRAMDWQGDYITEFDCFIAVNSKYDSPFYIDRIVLNFKGLPPLMFNNLGIEFEGKGTHNITLKSYTALEANAYSSAKPGLNLLSGTIHFGSVYADEMQVYKIFNHKFVTDW